MKRKKDCQIEHGEARLMERFGVKMTQRLHDTIVNRINTRNCDLVLLQSNRVRIYDMDVDGLPLRIVWDRYRRVIASVLTRDMIHDSMDLSEYEL
jgi:hypothetical protein